MKKYLISWHDSAKNTGGIKAKNDVETFLKQEDFKIIDSPSNKLGKLLFVFFLLPLKLVLLKPDIILIQFPTGTFNLLQFMTNTIKTLTSAKLIFLIHDLETLRLWNERKISDTDNIELSILKKSDGIISLNETMSNWLRKHGITQPISNLKIWDYDMDLPVKRFDTYSKTIGLAGNLEKSTFITKLPDNVNLFVYGPNPLKYKSKGIKYMGSFPADILPQKLNMNWGLVWDGDSLDTCSGQYGKYLQFNNPHKLSLYLSLGIPVIIWKKAALAPFIKKNNLGILVDNLNNLNEVIESISEKEYFDIQKNVASFSDELRSGNFLKAALSKIIIDLL